jgi:hypothetical protein
MQEMNTRGVLSALAGINPKDSNQVSMGAMKWVILYLPSVMRSIAEDISHNTAEMCWSPIMHSLLASGTSSITWGKFLTDLGCDCALSRRGKRSGPTTQSPTVPAQILMLVPRLEYTMRICLCPLVVVVEIDDAGLYRNLPHLKRVLTT